MNGEEKKMREENQADSAQYVSFMLGEEEYGIPIIQVQEIIRFEKITKIPLSSDFIRGVLDLRGRVMPAIDLRLKFGLPIKSIDRLTRIVVVDTNGINIGVIVDEVSEVITIESSQIEPPPELGTNIRTDFISSMGKLEDRLVILLDINRIFTEEEFAGIEDTVRTAA